MAKNRQQAKKDAKGEQKPPPKGKKAKRQEAKNKAIASSQARKKLRTGNGLSSKEIANLKRIANQH